MKVAILGGGVIGVTSAYYLAKAGHEVTVIDRQPSVALETSFANAGEISPGYASPWAAPGIPRKAIKWLFMEHAPLILGLRWDAEMLRWLGSLLRNCTSARYAVNKSRMVRLAEFSRDKLIELRRLTGIQYDQRMQGTLQLFRTQKQFDGIGKDVEVLRAGGVPFEVMDRERCIEIEPGLRPVAAKLVGGLRLPNDETGDCFKFTNSLAELSVKLGVRYQFETRVHGVRLDGSSLVAVDTCRGAISADAYVLALGSFSAGVARRLGLHLPVYPVKGYSITVPIVDESRAPESTLMDETYKIAITRLGSRIRVGGMAEIAGYDNTPHLKRRTTLEHSLGSLFPGAADLSSGTFWSGLRPMTPDGTPLVGATAISNLFLNTGHGTLGWTMACGSGHVLSDIIGGKRTEIDVSDLSLGRYRT
jgi:D-amino-acid dehydrogenase